MLVQKNKVTTRKHLHHNSFKKPEENKNSKAIPESKKEKNIRKASQSIYFKWQLNEKCDSATVSFCTSKCIIKVKECVWVVL